jgi:hypothetical protein
MTVNTEQAYQKYVGNGSTTMFSIPFGFLDDEIVVLKGGTWEAYEQGKDYSLMDCDVVFTTAPAEGVVIYIARKVVLKQLVDFIDGDSFPAENYEYSLDHITHALQELYMLMQQTLKSPLGTDPLEYFANALSGGGADLTEVYKELSDIKEELGGVKTTLNDISSSVNTLAEKSVAMENELAEIRKLPYSVNFIDVLADGWQEGMRQDYPYYYDIKLNKEEHPIGFPTVIFSDEQADSGNFSSRVTIATGLEVDTQVEYTIITIYAKEKPAEDFTILEIRVD